MLASLNLPASIEDLKGDSVATVCGGEVPGHQRQGRSGGHRQVVQWAAWTTAEEQGDSSWGRCIQHKPPLCSNRLTMGLCAKERITFRIKILTLSCFESLILLFVKAKLFQIRILKREKWRLDRDPPRKPDSEDVWTQSSFGTWYVRAQFRNVCWSRNKILSRSAQILFVIGTAVAMLVNAGSSNHEPNQEADRDPKWLSECDSLLCEQALSVPKVSQVGVYGESNIY